ncbi:MAG TPA: phage holin family protein [Candidatus Dormibacteraeota bacterium]|nr:phage holin family protein [Candidatus Dormibacteraeota bacterium]
MAAQNERSVPEVLQDIVRNLQEIIRSEFRLAKTEIKEEGGKARRPGITIGWGLILAIYAVGILLLAIVYALSTALAPWLAALIVGVVVLALSGAFIITGTKKLKEVRAVPEKTIESVKENLQWAKHQIK